MRHIWTAAATTATVIGSLMMGGPATASPPQDAFDDNNGTWACATEALLPPAHCLNIRSQGNTGVIKVFEPDSRWPQESISFDPKSDSRPCPHDPAATDGTWWTPPPLVGAWVCHHRP